MRPYKDLTDKELSLCRASCAKTATVGTYLHAQLTLISAFLEDEIDTRKKACVDVSTESVEWWRVLEGPNDVIAWFVCEADARQYATGVDHVWFDGPHPRPDCESVDSENKSSKEADHG